MAAQAHARELSRSVYAVPDLPKPGVVPPEAFADLPASMWDLSNRVVDATLRELHTSLVQGMRRDAAHLPTGTLQAMQIERICSVYILIRYNESTGQWRSDSDRRATYKLWRDMTVDFNSIVYGGKVSPDDLRNIVQTHTAKIIAAVLAGLPVDQSRPLYPMFASALDADSA